MPDSVSIWEEKATIPTYPVGPPDKNPIFYAGRGYQGARGPVYPYPMLDKLSDRVCDRDYRAVYLENEYLKLSILPEIGGRIMSARDKTNGYDFFYRQGVIKPALIGMLGAWISGGVEWNTPHHHRPTTFMPVPCLTLRNADGSATAWVGEIELRHRMKWLVGVTMHPGRSWIEVTVKVINRTPLAHSMLYFTNAAVSVNPGYQVIFPPSTEYGTQHAKCEFVRWPVADGVYAGVDFSAGADVSYWKNHPNWTSIFTIDSPEDFFGGYDHAANAGVAHVADHHVCPGKKFFTFGNCEPGRMWDRILTDADGPYLELMAGAYSDNQPDYSWIAPFETRVVTEYWYPLRGLGGMKNATISAAVNLSVNGRSARVAFNATSHIDGAAAILKAGDTVLLEKRVAIGPDAPFAATVALPDGVREEDLRAALYSQKGRELVSYRPARPAGAPRPKPVEPPKTPREMATNEELYLAGLRLEQFHNPALEPSPYYEEALRRDPGDSRVNNALGVLYLKRGLFEEAAAKLRAAVERVTANHTRPKDCEPLYYLGLALRALGDRRNAVELLERAAWSFQWRSAARHVLAEMAMEDGSAASALVHLAESLSCNAFDARAICLKSTVARALGHATPAAPPAVRALAIDPLDFFAANERALSVRESGDRAQSEQFFAALAGLMAGDPQAHLELAWDYANCGRLDDAVDVLARVPGVASGAPVHPMVHYTLAWLLERSGDTEAAARHYRLGAGMPPEGCFPFRLESIKVLEAAIHHNPADSRAPYYLGNLLYDLQPERAEREWERSRDLDGSFATVHRNLGFAASQLCKDYAGAAAHLDRAVECDSGDPRLFFERDVYLANAGAPHAKRLDLLTRNHAVVSLRDDALLREAVIFNLLGQHDRALEILDSRHFHIWEGGENSAHDVYVDAHTMRGRVLLREARPAEALAHFSAAAQYPERFEMGRPYDHGREPEVAFLEGTALEALGDDENAAGAFLRALERDKTGTALSYWQGRALEKLGRAEEALARYDALGAVATRLLSGAVEVGFFEKFGAAQTDAARHAHAHYLRGLSLRGKGDAAAARAEFETAARLDINNLAARAMLENEY